MMGWDGTGASAKCRILHAIMYARYTTAMQKIDHAALHSKQQAHRSHSSLSTAHARLPACGPARPRSPPFVHSVRVARMGKGLLGGVEFIVREGTGSAVPVPCRSALVVPLFLFFQFVLGNTVDVFLFFSLRVLLMILSPS